MNAAQWAGLPCACASGDADPYGTDAYRTVYALQLGERLWVLHAFQKKAKQGSKTPKKDIDLIRERLKRLKKELQQ